MTITYLVKTADRLFPHEVVATQYVTDGDSLTFYNRGNFVAYFWNFQWFKVR